MTDGSRALTPLVTAGLDLGDKYSYLCLIDQQSAEVMEEGRLRTTPEVFLRRFDSEQQITDALIVKFYATSAPTTRLVVPIGDGSTVAEESRTR
jgi:hypothetical protein